MMDKETDSALDAKVKEFKEGQWKAVYGHFASKVEATGKRIVPTEGPEECGFEIYNLNKLLFRVSLGFMRYWPNKEHDYWHLGVTMFTGPRDNLTRENPFSKQDINLVPAKEIIDRIDNILRSRGL
jgi:hypothetical protein